MKFAKPGNIFTSPHNFPNKIQLPSRFFKIISPPLTIVEINFDPLQNLKRKIISICLIWRKNSMQSSLKISRKHILQNNVFTIPLFCRLFFTSPLKSGEIFHLPSEFQENISTPLFHHSIPWLPIKKVQPLVPR